MPITISLSPLNVDSSASNFVYAIGTLTFSGNYPTGGDTLDFTQVADKLPSTQIVQAFAESQNGNSGYYIPVQGSALNNWKLKAFVGGGTEVTAGAYPASITSDIVQLAGGACARPGLAQRRHRFQFARNSTCRSHRARLRHARKRPALHSARADLF